MGQVRTRSTGLAAKARGTGAAPQLNHQLTIPAHPRQFETGIPVSVMTFRRSCSLLVMNFW